MFTLNAENIVIGIPFVMHPNGIAEELNIDVPSVYPDTKTSVFVEETFGAWTVVASRPTEEVTESLLSTIRNRVGKVFALVTVSSYCEENDCVSCDSYDCDVKLVLIKKK